MTLSSTNFFEYNYRMNEMTDLLRVEVDEKYTVIQDENGKLYALRYGEPWRDLVGDNLILRMAQQLAEFKNRGGVKQE